MKDIHEKLAVWARLSKQCQLLESRLTTIKLADRALAPDDTSSMEAELLAVKSKTEAAFKDASDAIRSGETTRRSGYGLRRGPVALSS